MTMISVGPMLIISQVCVTYLLNLRLTVTIFKAKLLTVQNKQKKGIQVKLVTVPNKH